MLPTIPDAAPARHTDPAPFSNTRPAGVRRPREPHPKGGGAAEEHPGPARPGQGRGEPERKKRGAGPAHPAPDRPRPRLRECAWPPRATPSAAALPTGPAAAPAAATPSRTPATPAAPSTPAGWRRTTAVYRPPTPNPPARSPGCAPHRWSAPAPPPTPAGT